MGLIVAGLVVFGRMPVVASVLVALWGMAFGGVQVGWPTWLTRTVPDEAESAGGLQVATVQLAITTGAGVGGLFFDLTGATGVYISSSVITLLAAFFAMLAFQKSTSRVNEIDQVDEAESRTQAVA
jgi:predicted MFS family arabinose efflux permease